MPRRKTDGETGTNNTGQPVKQPRVRKKKEPSSICSTPTGEHPPGGLKLETPHSMGGMPPPGCGPMDGPPMPHGMMAGGMPMPGMHMQHLGLPNGTPCGPPGCPSGPHGQQMMDDGNNGPGGMLPYGTGQPHPQGNPFEFYQQGPTGSSSLPHFAQPPMHMYSGPGGPMPGPPPPHMMMQQQPTGPGQPPPPQMGPPPVPPGQFHPSEQEQPHPHQQMMHSMHPHHPGAQPGPGPLSAPQGAPQMPPQSQMPPHPIFPGTFPRQPGPLMLIPPPPSIPQPPFLEFRIQEMNRRLFQFHSQFYVQAPGEPYDQWWDAFSQEFFDDHGRMTLVMHEYSAEQGGILVQKQYIIPRRLIPRFYRSLFTSGVSQLHYLMRSPAQELIEPQRMQNPEMFGSCALSCENLLMVTHHQQPSQNHQQQPIMAEIQVHTECRFYVEFAPFNPTLGYRIRHWCMELRSHQEFLANCKDGMQHQLERTFTSLGLPIQTHSEIKMWQVVQEMQPIVERAKDSNESPQLALHQIVAENGARMEMERQQRMAHAAGTAAAQIQTPPHSQPGPGSVGPPSNHPMAAIMAASGTMGPPQMPLPMGGMPPLQMGSGGGGHPQPAPQPTTADEQKPKPKRQRQRKTAAQNAAAAAAVAGANSSPPKGKKGQTTANTTQAMPCQQTPPAGMAPMGPTNLFSIGAPPGPAQFHPGGMPPPGQYHHDVLTVGEPSMMGNEYGDQDERQISRVENTAFSGMNHPSVSQGGGLMLPPAGVSMAGGSSGQMGIGPPRQMSENVQSMLGEFDMHQQRQQQMQLPPNGMWGPQPPSSSDNSQQQQPPSVQQAMSTGSS